MLYVWEEPGSDPKQSIVKEINWTHIDFSQHLSTEWSTVNNAHFIILFLLSLSLFPGAVVSQL